MSPLRGARVLVTRAEEDAPALEDLLVARGGAPLRFPCIAFEDAPGLESLVARVRAGADLVVLSSPYAARRLFALLGPVDLPFAAAGAATRDAFPGARSCLIPPGGRTGAQPLLELLAPLVAGKRVLVPRAEGGNPELVLGLTRAGAQVEALTLYRTVTAPRAEPAMLAALEEGRVDAIAFASGSAVRGFASLAGPARAAGSAVACMGARCAAEARALGIPVDAVGDGGLPELCDALALALSNRRLRAPP